MESFYLFPFSFSSYTYEDDRGIFPETQFVFDLEMPESFQPVNIDGEVQAFYLLTMEEVTLRYIIYSNSTSSVYAKLTFRNANFGSIFKSSTTCRSSISQYTNTNTKTNIFAAVLISITLLYLNICTVFFFQPTLFSNC